MPAAILIPLIAAGATAAGTVVAAKMASGANRDAAKLTTDSANHAADLQTQSAKDALDFQKSQAAQDLVTHNATAKANYDQWAAREKRISSLGSALGLAPRDIPAFVPTPGPASSATSAANPSGTGGVNPSGNGLPQPTASDLTPPPQNATPDQVGHFVASYFASKGVTPQPTSVNYFVQKWPELVARGQELGNPNYPLERLAAADEFGGGGASGASSTTPKNLIQMASYTPTTPGAAPALQAPQAQPWTLSSAARWSA